MKWARLPVDVFVDNESPFYFKVVVRMWKPDATKATLHRVMDALSELSDEDTHLYFSIRVDEEVWYIHSFRYEVVQAKAYMVSDEGALVPHEETDTQALKHQPQQLLYLVLNVKSLDELKGFSILTPEEFERRTA